MTLDLNNASSACSALRRSIGIDYPSKCPICDLGPCHWHAPPQPIRQEEIDRVARNYCLALGLNPDDPVKAPTYVAAATGSTTELRWQQYRGKALEALAMELALLAK